MVSTFEDTIDEAIRDGRKALREDQEKAEILGTLVRHPGWKVYMRLVESHKQSFGDVLLRPAGGLDGAINSEYIKGVVCGLLLATNLPGSIIDDMKRHEADEELEDAT